MSSQTRTVDVTMVDLPTDHPLFDEAIEAVQHIVTDEHRRIFRYDADPPILLREFRSVGMGSDPCDSTHLASRKFALFVRAFAPYFNVLGICVNVRAEWHGCFWGLVHLVFHVTRSHMLFLEKSADMFEALANLLPPYGQIYERIGSTPNTNEDRQLSTLMSYVYADIISLCLNIYKVFHRGLQDTRNRNAAFISSTTQWRPLDSRFAHLESRISHHRRWLEAETRSQIQDFGAVEHQRTKYTHFLQREFDGRSSSNREFEEQRIAKRSKRVDKVKGWISSNWLPNSTFNDLTRQTSLKSSSWFLESTKYRSWKGESFDLRLSNDSEALRDNWHDRILFVQGQPGFGKTHLARAVIIDLFAEADDLDIVDDPPSLAFFHVNTNETNLTHSDEIFRMLVLQLLHTHRHDHATLDAVCLLLRKTSFQDTASANEVLDILAVLLRQHPTFLVIDGLEGVRDVSMFLSSLAKLHRQADAKAILFSRPGVKIPVEYQKWASDAPHTISLTKEHSFFAIEQYLGEGFGLMASKGHFKLPLESDIVTQIAHMASGSFLWADMFIKYLQSPTLTVEHRYALFDNIQSLQGLEALLHVILDTLSSRPLLEKQIIADVFRWLSSPVNTLCASALRTALASSLNAAELEEVFPTTDIIDALPQLTGSLVEVTDNNVYFAHSAIREYLQSPASQDSEFSMQDENNVHAYLAIRCLSYLAHRVPKRPLCGLSPQLRPILPSSATSQRTNKSADSGYKSVSSSESDNHITHAAVIGQHANASQTSIRTIPFDTNLPFLRYASLCWPIHLSRALTPTQNFSAGFPNVSSPLTVIHYLHALSEFLSSRLAVTAWVEASFRYNLPPTLTRLVGPLSDLKAEVPPMTVEGEELRLVLEELGLLSEKLVELKREFSPNLRENPSLIWQMDGVNVDNYWPIWDGSTGMPRPI